ncbi:alpha/beta fold hydrolase [Streptomyces sp. MN13]
MNLQEKFPIVYVRGFAGDTSGINKVVTDPFYGFNEGSTHVRVGPGEKPTFHQFESPLLRLHLDDGYHVLVEGGQESYLDSHRDIPADSIWVHRFYDASATGWGADPREFRLEDAAADLLRLIRRLREKTGAPRVFLVAHSMGGSCAAACCRKFCPNRARIRRTSSTSSSRTGHPTAASSSTRASASSNGCGTPSASRGGATSSGRAGCTST